MSQLTTHILDTSLGKPAAGVAVVLEQKQKVHWKSIAEGTTNSDGRIMDLLDSESHLDPGTYRLVFDTLTYFNNQQKKTFYPQVTVEFSIADRSHYHVPLLLNPFGYSTYRGS